MAKHASTIGHQPVQVAFMIAEWTAAQQPFTKERGSKGNTSLTLERRPYKFLFLKLDHRELLWMPTSKAQKDRDIRQTDFEDVSHEIPFLTHFLHYSSK